MKELLRRAWHALSPTRRREAAEVHRQMEERHSLCVHLLHPEQASSSEARRALEDLLSASPFVPARPIKAHHQEGLVVYFECSLQEMDNITQLLTEGGFELAR